MRHFLANPTIHLEPVEGGGRRCFFLRHLRRLEAWQGVRGGSLTIANEILTAATFQSQFRYPVTNGETEPQRG